MKRRRLVLLFVILTLIISLLAFPRVDAVMSVQEKAVLFISSVLPLDLSKYSCTLTQYGSTTPTTEGCPTMEQADYTLKSAGSKLVVDCSFQDTIFTGCLVIVKEGSILSDRPYEGLVDSARSFLERYQNFTGNDLTDMINALTNADPTKNTITTSGNIKLATLTQTIGVDMVETSFRWTYTVNGADYTALGISFRNGVFYALRDDSSLYKIGNTDVNITKEQAINSALNYVKNYSYTGITGSEENPQHIEISGFNITTEQVTAKLSTYPRDPSTLYPCWLVQLPLKTNYPGNVWALSVNVWADSGQVFLCQPLATGGSNNSMDNSTSTSSPPLSLSSELPETSLVSTNLSPVSTAVSENNAASVDAGTVIIALVLVLTTALVTIGLVMKRHKLSFTGQAKGEKG